jgi:hypothetical protein
VVLLWFAFDTCYSVHTLLKGDLLSAEPDLGIPQTLAQAGAKRGAGDAGDGMDDDAVVLNVMEEGGAEAVGRATGAAEPQGVAEQEMTQRTAAAAAVAAAGGGSAFGTGQAWRAEGGGEVYGSMDMLRRERRILVIHSAARIALDDPIQVGTSPRENSFSDCGGIPAGHIDAWTASPSFVRQSLLVVTHTSDRVLPTCNAHTCLLPAGHPVPQLQRHCQPAGPGLTPPWCLWPGARLHSLCELLQVSKASALVA